MVDVVMSKFNLNANILWQSTQKVAQWRRSYSSSPNRTLEGIVPFIGTKTAIFKMTMYGVTVKGIHKVILAFDGVDIKEIEYQHTNRKDGIIKVDADYIYANYENKTYQIQKPIVSKNPIRVRCSCPDFYHTFAWYNFDAGCLFGPRPRPYQRKTTTRPERNPKHYPGLCKHTINTILSLQTSKIVKP